LNVSASNASIDKLRRDSTVLTLYSIGGLLGFGVGLLSPVIKELRTDSHLSYTVAALHSTAYAIGFVISGTTGDRLVGKLGRSKMLWLAMVLLTFGVILLCSGHHLFVTLPGALLVGAFGVFVQIVSTAVLSERHAAHRTTVVAEWNAVVVLVGALSPVAVGLFVLSPLGWRAVSSVGIVLFIAVAILRSKATFAAMLDTPAETVTEILSSEQPADARLPASFWWSWLLMVVAVASEFAALIWSVTYFQNQLGASSALAAVLGGTFFLAEGIGRMLGGPFSRRLGSAQAMLLSIGLAVVGFFLFWSFDSIPLGALGYFVMGLGIANLGIFPTSLALSVAGEGRLHDIASTRLAAAIGLAMLTGPFVLGWLADGVGIRHAYLVLPALLAVTAGLSVRAHRLTASRLEEAKQTSKTLENA
jgi:MFS family permease